MPPVQRPQQNLFDDFPGAPHQDEQPDDSSLSLGKKRVLQVLAAARGPLTRAKIQSKLGVSSTYVAKSVGLSDPEKREAFEQTKDAGGKPGEPCPSLLTLGYVREFELVILEDGINELTVEITQEGRKAFEALGGASLPPLGKGGRT